MSSAKKGLIGILGTAAVALLIVFLWSSRSTEESSAINLGADQSAEHSLEPATVTTPQHGAPGATTPQNPGFETQRASITSANAIENSWPGDSEPPLPGIGPMDITLSIEDSLEALKTQMDGATAADITNRRADAAEGDAEAALWLAMFFEECASAPPSYELLDRRLAQVEQQVKTILERNPETELGDWPDRVTREAIDRFEMCSDIPGEPDLVLESFNYYGLAADLGHPTAQRAYHAHANYLLMNNGRFPSGVLGFQQPMLIEEFKQRAQRYADLLWNSGTPHALTLLARMYYQGDVYPRDLVMTYAYAQAAILEGSTGTLQAGGQWKELTRYLMTQDQVSEAEDLAHDLLRQHRERARQQ